MRRIVRLMSAAVTSGALAVLFTPGSASAATVEALYEMNEADGATVMVDSSGNGLDGTIDQAGLNTGVAFDGAIGYQWAFRSPTAPPASPERVIQVADNAHLDPLGGTFTVEIRYRTQYKFGNIIQKGQSASVGGQWKIQNPGGLPSCLFKGPSGRVATRSTIALNNNQWHTLTCVKTPTRVTMFVDGVFNSLKNGSTGVIDNKIPMTIGGKVNCDQIEVTCDYYSGMIDYVQLTKG